MKNFKPNKSVQAVRIRDNTQSADANSLPDEQDLWIAFRSGSRSAFEQLYYRHINLLYDYGIRLSRDAPLAEDCVQDLFTYLWVNRQKLPQVRTVKAYLLVSLKRRVYRKLAEQQRDLSKLYEAPDVTKGFEPNIDQQAENIAALKQAFAQISEKQQEVIYLRFYNQLTYEEIAEVMDVQVKAVYKLMSRAMAGLRKHLGQSVVSQLLFVILAS